MNRKVLLLGLAVVLPLVGALLANIGRYPNPSLQRSPMLGRVAPAFSLNPVGGGPPISLEGLRTPFTVLPIQIFNWISRPQTEFHENAAAGTIVLLVVLLGMNALAIYLRLRLQRQRESA